MADLKVENRPIDSLIPYANNARTHSPEQIKQIAASITEFGFVNPVLIEPSGEIIAGHGRTLAAKSLGMIEVPTIVIEGLSKNQIRALILADNKLAENAGWDEDLLKIELAFLEDTGLDTVTGFSDAEIAAALAEEGATNNIAEHWQGMPEFEQDKQTPFRTFLLHFKDQESVDSFAALLGRKFTDRTKYLWFPEREIESNSDQRYVAEV